MKHILKKLYVSLIAVCLVSSSSFAVPVAARGMSSERLNSAKITRPLLFEVESSQSAQSEAGLSQMTQSESELSQTAQSETGLSQTAQSEAELSQTASSAAESSKPAQPEATEAESTPLMASAKEQTAFFESVKIDGVKISVRAAAGTFPAGATLSVEKIPLRTQLTVDEAVEKERAEGANVAVSYSFDITVKDVDGNELQPADGHRVEVAFELAEVKDQNLDTSVFHIEEEDGELNVSSLDVTVSDKAAVVLTESFSIYTVEFTYAERQYVMSGGEVLPLRDILDKVELYGDVTSVEVSDSALFEAYRQHGEWYVKSNAPFLTDEWMRVTIDDIEYEIKVTDAVNINGYGDPDNTWPTVPQITQGTDGKTFAADAPLASIQIDYSILGELSNAVYQKLSPDPGLITLPGTELYSNNGQGADATDINGIFASYDTNQPGAYTRTLSRTADNLIEGDLFSFRYRDAAILEDGSRADVVLVYSNLHINLQTNAEILTGTFYIVSGNMIRSGNTNDTSSNTTRNGIQIDVNIHVEDKDGNIVPGTFSYPMSDIDVQRIDNDNFGKIYGAENLHNYSEMIAIRSGYIGNIFIPDYEGIDEEYALNSINKKYSSVKPEARGYKTGIDIYQYEEDGQQKEAVRFIGLGKGDTDPGTYYSGFYSIADNTSGGINITAWTSGSKTAVIRATLLNGKQTIHHSIKSTTTEGGTIKTTSDGNLSGELNDGSTVIGSATVLVSDGKTVKYTMTPDKGFYCNEIYIGDELDASKNKTVIPRVDLEKLISGELSEITVTLNDGGYTETLGIATNVVGERTGTLTYDSGNGAFIFEFPNNNYDHRIHVDWDWKPIYDLEVKKIVKGTQSSIYQYFPFTIRIEIPDGADIRMCSMDTAATNYDTDDVVKASIYYKSTDVVNQPTSLSDFIPEPGQSKEVTVWLRHGQSVKLLNLPDGTTYSITENEGEYTETVISKTTLRNNMESSGSGYRGSIKTAGTFTRELIQVCEPAPSGTTGRYIRSGTKTFFQKIEGSYTGTRYDYDESSGEFRESTDGSGAYGKVEIAMYEEIDPSTYSGDEQKYIMTSSYWLYEKSHTITHINEKDAPVPTSVSLGLLPAISCAMLGCGGIGGVLLGRRRDDDE